MKLGKNKLKTVIALVLLSAVCIFSVILDLNDAGTDVYPDDDTRIMLYGETHGVKEYYDIEFELWKSFYDEGCRDLFVELPYYSAEFLNIWMKEDSNELLDIWFDEIDGTLSGNEYYYDFLQDIKEACPETVFYGTDVGHQFDTTGARYLKYLEDNGLEDSENYALAEDCIKQGIEYYEDDERNDLGSELREAYMMSDFKAAYERQGGGRIMGIYGSYHTDLTVSALMAGQLKAHYGDIISSVKISSITVAPKDPYELGLCITGLIFLILLFVPNIVWACGRRPEGYEQAQKQENRILTVFERIGEVAVTVSLLTFPSADPIIKILPGGGIYFRWRLMIWLAAFVLMILYELYWIKYFKGSRTMENMYSSFAGFPVAGATLPVLAVLLLGFYSRNSVLIISAVILGIGHIGIHLAHKRDADEK